MSLNRQLPEATVFFARDFLTVEFARLGLDWPGGKRVYIVVNRSEREQIEALDPAGEVIELALDRDGKAAKAPPTLEVGFNIDRSLRYLDDAEVSAVLAAIDDVCEAILSRYRVAYYFDEPVSGHPNWVFNRRFTEQGALCLHFQASWVPGFLYFTADAAQLRPVPLRLISRGAEIVQAHLQARAAGQGRPLYVLNYGKVSKRVSDILATTAKAGYRMLFRRSAAYIDRDPSAHLLHAHALAASLTGRYQKAVDPADKLLVFPLHYEPEAVLLYMGKFTRQEEIAARLLDSLPLGWKLVLKEHPSQPGALQLGKWADLRRSKRVVGLRGDFSLGSLLPRKPVVVSIGSTFALEAALAGCRVGLLGGVHFATAPGLQLLDEPEDWLRLLDLPEPAAQDIASWYADFIDTYCFEGSIMRGKTDLGDRPALIRALQGARQEVYS